MKKSLLLTMLAAAFAMSVAAQNVSINRARYHQGDDMNWAKPETSDANWEELDITKTWDDQGKSFNNTFVWYRIHVNIPSSLMKGVDQQKTVVFDLPSADDADETYLNGKLIGKTGRFHGDQGGYQSAWNARRSYSVDAKSGGIRWDQENIIAVRVYNAGEPGGLFGRPLTVRVPNITDGLRMQFSEAPDGQTSQCTLELNNEYPANQVGTVTYTILSRETGAVQGTLTRKVTVRKGKPVRLTLPYDKTNRYVASAKYVDAKTGKFVERQRPLKFLLTPPAPATPRFNTPAVFGVRPGSPVIFRFGVSGEKPIKITSNNLPEGLNLTEEGVLSGSIRRPGDLAFTVTAENAKGRAQQQFTLKVGSKIALTPPRHFSTRVWQTTDTAT